MKSILDRGGFAVGIEGSDYSKLRKRAEWATIPDHLFTADITEPFQLLEVNENGQEYPIQFNLITAWEVMEHIHKDKLNCLIENISAHLSPHGVVIMSINTNEEIINGVRLHQTVEDRDWWISKFSELGFGNKEKIVTHFGREWVRGEQDTLGSFHLGITRSGENLPFDNRLRLAMPVAKMRNATGRIAKTLRNKALRTLSLVTPSPVKRVYRRIRDR